MKDEDIQMFVMCLVICLIAWFTSTGGTSSSIEPPLCTYYAEPARESSEMILYRLFGNRVFGRTKRKRALLKLSRNHGG